MASAAGSRIVRGSFIAKGTARNIDTPEKPIRVELINVSDPAVGVYHDHMPAGSIMVQTDTFVNVSSNGVTLNDQGDGDGFTGFQVGTDANFNTDGEQVHWSAWY